MGSGLVLLAIVGAWLVVLVPMALRRYDTSNRSADRFQDAMRVLSRRSGTAPVAAPVAEAERPAVRVDVEVDDLPTGRLEGLRDRWAGSRADRPPLTPAARRRRLLLGLLAVSLASLVGLLLGPAWLLVPHLLADAALVAYVVHLRRTAAARAERERRTAAQRRRRPQPAAEPVVVAAPLPEPVLRVPVHVAGIPSTMPPRPAPLAAPAELPAARGAQGEAWSPVPVPTPTYLSAPTAPRRSAELATSDGVADAEREIGIVDEGPELEDILERRRAVNDW